MIAILFASLLNTSYIQDHPKSYLASIVGLGLSDSDYVDGFEIDTWGVTIRSVCHFPPGWSIEAGSSADPSGQIKGNASLGVTYLDRKRLSELRGLVLITLYAPVQKSTVGHEGGSIYIPSTFNGYISVGTYGADGRTRKIRVAHRNINLTPADRCPRLRD